MNPKVSIILPVFQVEKYIENSMISICNQTFKDFEVILVNDGTRDKSIEIAEKVLLNGKINFKLIHQENKGVSAARNNGISNASGDYIICVDPDDIISKKFIEILYYSAIDNSCSFSISNFRVISQNLFYEPNETYENEIISRDKLLNLFLCRQIKVISPSMLINRQFILENNLFYDEKITFSEDQHYIWKVMIVCDKCSYNKAPLYNYYVRENSTMTSSSIDKIMTGYFGFLKLTNELQKENDNIVFKMIMPRWVLGVLHSSSKMMGYSDFKKLSEKIEYKKYINKLIYLSDFRVSLPALIIKTNLKLFYYLIRTFKF